LAAGVFVFGLSVRRGRLLVCLNRSSYNGISLMTRAILVKLAVNIY